MSVHGLGNFGRKVMCSQHVMQRNLKLLLQAQDLGHDNGIKEAVAEAADSTGSLLCTIQAHPLRAREN